MLTWTCKGASLSIVILACSSKQRSLLNCCLLSNKEDEINPLRYWWHVWSLNNWKVTRASKVRQHPLTRSGVLNWHCILSRALLSVKQGRDNKLSHAGRHTQYVCNFLNGALHDQSGLSCGSNSKHQVSMMSWQGENTEEQCVWLWYSTKTHSLTLCF